MNIIAWGFKWENRVISHLGIFISQSLFNSRNFPKVNYLTF